MWITGKIMIDVYERAYQYDAGGTAFTVVFQPRELELVERKELRCMTLKPTPRPLIKIVK